MWTFSLSQTGCLKLQTEHITVLYIYEIQCFTSRYMPLKLTFRLHFTRKFTQWTKIHWFLKVNSKHVQCFQTVPVTQTNYEKWSFTHVISSLQLIITISPINPFTTRPCTHDAPIWHSPRNTFEQKQTHHASASQSIFWQTLAWNFCYSQAFLCTFIY